MTTPLVFFLNDTATSEIYTYRHTLSLHDALPIFAPGVGQRQQDLYQRDAVGVAVVQARDERRAALVALDQVELPERPVLVERTRGELAGEAFQRALLRAVARRPAPVALSGQRGELHVPVEVEMRVLLPGRTRRG